MTTITIELPDMLRQRVEKIAASRGDTIDDLVQELLEEYLEEIEDVQEATEIKDHIASGEERTYTHDEVWAEIDEMERKIGALSTT